MRVVDAQTVLDKPGSVVLWTNCHHPFYERNPYPDGSEKWWSFQNGWYDRLNLGRPETDSIGGPI